MAEEQISFDIYQPFGPSVLKTKLPQLYVDALNKQSDDILNDEEKSKERDWSHNPVSYTHLTLPPKLLE